MPFEIPLTLNPAPVELTLEIVISELPLLVTAAFKELLLPSFTLPKLRLVGLMPRERVAAIPVPLRPTAVGEVGALLTIEILPVAEPAAVGRKTAVIVVC